MYEDSILEEFQEAGGPLSIADVKGAVERRVEGGVSYETVKKDLLTLSAKGLINCKSLGGGKRVSWVFWHRDRVSQPMDSRKEVNPFGITISERDSMSPEEVGSLYDDLIRDYGNLIQASFCKGSRFAVLCDGKVVGTTSHEPSDEDVRDLERRLGKVCYVLTKDLIEESPWSNLGNGDYYPTIQVFVGGAQWKEEEVFDRGLQMVSDFDTGNPDVAAFNNEDLNLVQPTGTPIVRRAFHLSRHYDYRLAKVRIGVRDASGRNRCIQKMCRGVFSWAEPDRNPFLLANPVRKALLGRDLMLAMPLIIMLSGRDRSSRVFIE